MITSNGLFSIFDVSHQKSDMKKILLFFIGIFQFILLGCNTGYQKEDGEWKYITWNGGSGTQKRNIEGVDNKTFKVLKKTDYAKDKNQVYYHGFVIKDADPKTFKFISGTSYNKDKNQVFLDQYPLVGSDTKTFEVLEFPYSKDANTVYCGTLPMQVENVNSFRVIKKSLGRVTGGVGYLIQQHPEMEYLDSILGDRQAVFSIGALAEAEGQFFKDYLEVERPDSLK